MRNELNKVKDFAINFKDKVGTTSLYIAGLIITLLIGLYVRTRNLKWLQGKYLLGLDPYCFYRYASIILEKGSLMAQDMMRYVPNGYILSTTDKFFSYCLAYGFKLIAWTGLDQMTFHIWYPAIAGIIGLTFLFLFVRELFDNKTALISTAFAAVIPAYIYRTGAGFADHEALAMVWMFASFWLFAKAWKAKKLWKNLSFAASSGLLAGLMTLTWGGYKFLYAAISIFVVLMLIFSKLKQEKLFILWTWISLAAIFIFIRNSGKIITSVRSYEFLLLLFTLFASILYFILKKIKISEKIKEKAPTGFIALAVAGILVLISAIFTNFVDLSALLTRLINPMSLARLSLTVSENAQPYFFGGNGWYSNFGLTIFLVLAGAILLFYDIFGGEKKYSGWLTAGWTATMFAFIFGKYRAGSAINNLFSNIYMYVFIAFVGLIGGIYLYTYNKDRNAFNKLFSAEWNKVLLFSWFVFSLVIARGAVRTIFALAPVAAIVAAYAIVKTTSWLWNNEKKGFAILLVLFTAFCLISNMQTSTKISTGSATGYPGQWEDSMNWIKENTSEDAVIAHWWDYGYWTLANGERASVVDGGNAMGWSHGMGRYGLLGRESNNYLSYYKTHEVTHLLISEEEIGKFHAFSTVGSDENFDLQSTIGIFSLQGEQDIRNGSRLTYGGGWTLDKDYLIGNKVLAKGKTHIMGFIMDKQDNILFAPQAIFYDGTDQFLTPLKCICQAGTCKIANENGFGGCLILTPRYTSNTQANFMGAAFFVSEKIEDTLFAKLYLKGETIDNFTEVYNDGSPLGLYKGNIIGPIKIWEINYPENTQSDDKYLERSIYG